MFKYLLLALLLTLQACSKETPKQSPYFEVQGSSTERIAQITKLLKQNTTPLESIVDAHFSEEAIGETGGIGPADYCGYYALSIAPHDIAQWEKALKPLEKNGSKYVSPAQAKDWWLTKQEFESLKFYDAFDLTSRSGWIGITKTGHIYIVGCTT